MRMLMEALVKKAKDCLEAGEYELAIQLTEAAGRLLQTIVEAERYGLSRNVP